MIEEVESPVRRIEQGEVLSPEELQKIPFFAGVSTGLLQKNVGAVVRRRFKKGEIICREGEDGWTAFYILEGEVDVFINAMISDVAKQPHKKLSWSQKMKVMLTGKKVESGSPKDTRYIPIDASIDLSMDDPAAKIGEGELFGEMTCLSFYPRSATVRAATDCVMLEMLRNVLQMLQKNKDFKAKTDEAYRKRTLDNHFRSVPMFKDLPDEFLDYLRSRVKLLQFEPDHVICRQRDSADSFYLIRSGHVKVSQSYPGGDMVISYLSRGQYFGEIGLLGQCQRTATCTALDRVEAVQVSREDFLRMMKAFPEIRERLEKDAIERLDANEAQVSKLETVVLNDYLGQSLMQAQNLLLLDLEKCTRCDDCVSSCAASHDGVTRLIREGPRYDKFLIATSCRQCRDPLCMVGCPVGSIHRQHSLEIVIENWCIGCGLCARQCPYDNIAIHEFTVERKNLETGEMETVQAKKATVCDLCAAHEDPSCVYACPHDAAQRVDPQKFFSLEALSSSLYNMEK